MPGSYSPAARKAAPAVVSIATRQAPSKNQPNAAPWFRFFNDDGEDDDQQMGLVAEHLNPDTREHGVIGIGRLQSRDRLEAEPVEFHERVRQEFLSLALLDPERYLVVDGRQSIEDISAAINSRVSELRDLNKIEKKPKAKKRIIKKPNLRKKSK